MTSQHFFHEQHSCRHKLRHFDFLSPVQHARRMDDGGLEIYLPYCGGSHMGHSQTPTAAMKLRRNSTRPERACKGPGRPGV
jgi:hypothetical protein